MIKKQTAHSYFIFCITLVTLLSFQNLNSLFANQLIYTNNIEWRADENGNQEDNTKPKKSSIIGVVRDKKTGELFISANVIVLENKYGCATNNKGKFRISNLKDGIYTVKASYLGYNAISKKVKVLKGLVSEINFDLISESFKIGNIEVLADNEFMPTDIETKTKISSGEIEHMQATSLGNVLELTPGTKTSNPTLNYSSQAQIRGGSTFGPQVILDEVPISNNVNMQIGIGYTSANNGLDLRSIPAENIENVEVVRGVPSVKYGDLTDGLIIVNTKSRKANPFNVKIKYNPNVYETNISGGFVYSNWIINSNFNLASSGRDVRIEGDGYTRISAQVNANKNFGKHDIKNSFYFTRTYDELKEDPGYALREAWYNKDYILRYSGKHKFNISSYQKLNSTISLSYTKRDSYKQSLISRDNMVITDRLTDGPQEGHIVFGSYLGKQWIKGNEISFYGDVNYNHRFNTGSFINNLLSGITFRSELNNGDGKIFNPLYPPSLSYKSPRIRRFDDFPSYNTLSIYLEDKISGRLLFPFTLQVGARYEAYRPSGFNVKGLWGDGDLIESDNGSFLNPRVNFSFNVFESTQIRLNYGVTTKSPALGMIYPQKSYFDIVDTVSVKNPEYPDSNFSIVTTNIRERENSKLKAYKQYKYEASIDQEVGFGGFSITAFLNKTENNFGTLDYHTVFYKHSYPEWPNSTNAVPIDTLFDKYSKYQGTYDTETKGLEFTFETRKIPYINTIFKFDAAYYDFSRTTHLGYRTGSRRYLSEINQEVVPLYKEIDYYTKNLLLNYRFDIQAKSLGMWVTLHVQQQVLEINGRENMDEVNAIGYFSKSNEMVIIPLAEQTSAKYKVLMDSVEPFELLEEDKPNMWLVNIKVSKSLWKGSAISFFVNNFFNNRPLHRNVRTAPNSPSYLRRNTPIFYGMEFHSTF